MEPEAPPSAASSTPLLSPAELRPSAMDACLAKWKKADDAPMSDEARYRLAVPWDDETTVRPGMVRLWPGRNRHGASDGTAVPLEFLFPEAPEEVDDRRFAEAFASALHAWLREERCAEFRALLSKKREGSLRRRNSRGNLEQLEAGDETEDNWRDYLRRPGPEEQEPPKAVALVLNPKLKALRVLVCRVALPPGDANLVGRLSFRHIFDEEEPHAVGGGLQKCLYALIAMFALMLITILGVLFRKIVRESLPSGAGS